MRREEVSSSLFFVIEIEKSIQILKWRGRTISPKNFQFFPKYTPPLSHGKVLKCSWPLSFAKVRKQESTPLKEYARVKGLCKLHNKMLFILCKRERKKFQKNY